MSKILVAFIGFVVLIVGLQAFYIVQEYDQVVVTQVGRYLRTDSTPGLYVKIPFYQSVTRFDKRVLSSDSTPAEYLTLDKKRLVVDTVTRWRITDAFQFYVTVQTELGAKARLGDLVFSELRQELASRDFDQIIGAERDPIMDRVAQRVADKARGFGIEVVDVRIKRADLPQEVQASVFSRMVAERERIAKRYRSEGEEEAAKIRAAADKERTILLAEAYEQSQVLRGEGEAQATAIYANAFGRDPEFYSFIRSLEAYERMLADRGSMVLTTDSDLFRYLSSSRLREEAPTTAATAP